MKIPIKIGKKYNHLRVLRKSENQTKPGFVLWDCLCDCGKIAKITSSKLNYGKQKTCGCARAKATRKDGTWIPSTHHWATKASRIMSNSKKNGVPFGFKSLSEFVIYLDEIDPKKCPVFNKKLVAGEKKHHNFSPSVDRIIPDKGYVRGNIQIISYLANRMKNNATPKELTQFAQWVMKDNQ